MRKLTDGHAHVEVDGSTLAEAIDALDALYPGIKARLVEGEKLRGGISVFVDNELPLTGLRTKLKPDSEVYFAPAISGG